MDSDMTMKKFENLKNLKAIIISLGLITVCDSMAMGPAPKTEGPSRIGHINLLNSASKHRLPLRAVIVHERDGPRHWTRSEIVSRLEWTARVLDKDCQISISSFDLYDLRIVDHHFDLDPNAPFKFLNFLNRKLDARKIAGIFGNDGVQTLFYLDNTERVAGGSFGISGPESFFPNEKDLWNKAWIPSDVLSKSYFTEPRMGVELHELGHNLLNDGRHWNEKNGYNIMLSHSVITHNPGQEAKQFTQDQCNKIVNHRSVLRVP